LLDEFPDQFLGTNLWTSGGPSTPYTRSRVTFYRVTGVPTAWFDGVLEARGAYTNDDLQYQWYLGLMNQRLAVPTDVTIELSAREVRELTYEVSVTVGIEPGGVGKTMRVHTLQLLDYYPTSTDDRYRNCVRKDAEQIVVTLAPGESTTLTPAWGSPGDPGYPYLVLTDESAQDVENVKLCAFAQEDVPNAPAEIYNAGQLFWPIAGVPGDVDGDGDVDLSDLAALLASYNKCEGDPDYNPAADFNGDGCVDLTDLATLLGNYPYP